MFDFAPVGAIVAVLTLLFIALVGWRLTPRREGAAASGLFEITEYISEVRIPDDAAIVGQSLYQLTSRMEKDMGAVVVGLVRGASHITAPSWYEVIQGGDILLVEADSEALQSLTDDLGLELEEDMQEHMEALESEEVRIIEATVSPDSTITGETAFSLKLRANFGVNLLAIARQGARLQSRLGQTRFTVGDILLLQGHSESLTHTLETLKCLPR